MRQPRPLGDWPHRRTTSVSPVASTTPMPCQVDDSPVLRSTTRVAAGLPAALSPNSTTAASPTASVVRCPRWCFHRNSPSWRPKAATASPTSATTNSPTTTASLPSPGRAVVHSGARCGTNSVMTGGPEHPATANAPLMTSDTANHARIKVDVMARTPMTWATTTSKGGRWTPPPGPPPWVPARSSRVASSAASRRQPLVVQSGRPDGGSRNRSRGPAPQRTHAATRRTPRDRRAWWGSGVVAATLLTPARRYRLKRRTSAGSPRPGTDAVATQSVPTPMRRLSPVAAHSGLPVRRSSTRTTLRRW